MSRTVMDALIVLQGVQVAFLLLHDWVPLGRLTNLSAVRGSDSTMKLLVTTVLSALPFALVFAVSCQYWNASHWPMWLTIWLRYTYCIALVSTAYAWWGPYLFWPNPERAARYKVRFAGTWKFLPERNGITPDTLHVLYHLIILTTVILLWML